MDINFDLGAVERLQGRPALIAYLAGAAIGALVALPILIAVFGFQPAVHIGVQMRLPDPREGRMAALESRRWSSSATSSAASPRG